MRARLRTRWGHPQPCANAHDSSLCGGSLWGGASCKASPERGGARHRRAEGFVPPTLAGRGGSVSRRDHNPAYRRHAHLSGGTKPEKRPNQNASRSSGERGLGGEGLLSEKPPLPPAFPAAYLFERGFGGERFSVEKCSPPKSFILFLDMRLGRVGRLGGRRRCRTS